MLSMLLLLHVMAKCWLCLDEPPMIFALTCIEKFWNDAFCVVSYEASTWRGMRSTGWKQHNFPARLGGILNHPIISNILMMLDYCSKYIFWAFKCSYEFHGNGKKKQVEICIIYIYIYVCVYVSGPQIAESLLSWSPYSLLPPKLFRWSWLDTKTVKTLQ